MRKNVLFLTLTAGLALTALEPEPAFLEIKEYNPGGRIELNGWRARQGRIPGAHEKNFDDSAWENASALYRWHGNFTECWFRREIVIDPSLDGKAVYLEVSVDAGGALFVDGVPRGEFTLLKKTLLSQRARAGDRFTVAIRGVSDTVFGNLVGAHLLGMDARLFELQTKIDAIEAMHDEVRAPLYESWNFLNFWWLKKNAPALFWKDIVVPETVNGIPVAGERLALELEVAGKFVVFLDGNKAKYDWDRSRVILTPRARPGETVTVAVMILEYEETNRLEKIALSLAEATDRIVAARTSLTEARELLERLPGDIQPGLTRAHVAADAVLAARGKKTLVALRAGFRQADGPLRAAAEIFQNHPLILKGPYLQNMTPDAVTVMWETNVPSDSTVYFAPTGDAANGAAPASDPANGAAPASDPAPGSSNGAAPRRATGNASKAAPAANGLKRAHDANKSKVHEIRLTGLSPQTAYRYRVQSARLASAENTFRTAVRRDTPFRFVVWGDNRTDPVAHERVVQAMVREKPAFAINVGDVVEYGSRYAAWRDEYFLPARDLLKSVPSYIAIGNHEYAGAGKDRRVAWFERFVAQPNNEYWFSFDYGNSHFIILDPNKYPKPDIPVDSEQYRWLLRDLESSASRNADWRFIVFHQPIYSEGWEGGYYDGEELLRERLVPLLEKYDVTMAFQGHTHDYEFGRWPLDTGPIYVIAGGGGSPLDDTRYRDWDQVQKILFEYHYCVIEIDGKKLRYSARDAFGKTFHEYQLNR